PHLSERREISQTVLISLRSMARNGNTASKLNKGGKSGASMKQVWKLLFAVAVAIGCVGASYGQNTNSSTADQKSQDRITREVRHQLVMIPQLSIFDNLAYKVDGNNVTLLGQVVNPVIKSEAESSVKGIEGVENVNNQIE